MVKFVFRQAAQRWGGEKRHLFTFSLVKRYGKGGDATRLRGGGRHARGGDHNADAIFC
jgi:hypothetical protein